MMSKNKMRATFVLAALVALCNDTMPPRAAQAQQLAGNVDEHQQEFGLIGSGHQVSFAPEGQFAGEQAAGALQQPEMRFRRQVSIPQGSPLSGQQQQQQAPQSPQAGGGTNVFSFLSELGPQVAQAKSFSSLFSSPNPNSNQPGGQQQQSGVSSALDAANLMNQLNQLVKSTQERVGRNTESAQQAVAQNVQTASQATTNAAQNAQGGIQSALADIGAGLQRIAANNPNLLPDVKNLYQSVSSKLTSASSSVAQAANPQANSGPGQFAQQLSSQVANPAQA